MFITGGALNFFSGRGVWPRFPKCGACELTFASEKGGLWAENFQIWGLVSWKFPNLGACELKISKCGGLWAKIWGKIEAVEAKISKFSQKGVLWTDFCLKWDPCERQERREKGVFRAAHPHTPFLGQCPPGVYHLNMLQSGGINVFKKWLIPKHSFYRWLFLVYWLQEWANVHPKP